MRPALQKLLQRQSSLDLLRYLVGTRIPTSTCSIHSHHQYQQVNKVDRNANQVATDQKAKIANRNPSSQKSDKRKFKAPPEKLVEVQPIKNQASELNIPLQDIQFPIRHVEPARPGGHRRSWRKLEPDSKLDPRTGLVKHRPLPIFKISDDVEEFGEGDSIKKLGKIETIESAHSDLLPPEPQPKLKTSRKLEKLDFGPWEEIKWTREEIEYQSDLTGEALSRPRLLDDPDYRRDLRLWASLLDYRIRVYGPRAAYTFWEAVKNGTLELPVTGPYARKFWLEFLDLGFEDDKVLHEIGNYADELLESTSKRWLGLYTTIIQHMLLSNRAEEAKQWHDRLIKNHPPRANVALAELFRLVIRKEGDLDALAYIYSGNDIQSTYSKIIPTLCDQENFDAAFKWHLLLIRKGDKPKGVKEVEPLVQFLAIYDPKRAGLVTKTLVETGVSFASNISLRLNENKKISREMMNLVHGKVLHIPVKEYNDNLGARWFATRWVSLDVALNAVHALGVQQIGPLSLQAIALREPDITSIRARLNQLQDLSISIGKSKFSRAVEKFARSGNQEFLDGLLHSDQHPDQLEDRNLQENLLAYYSRLQDWAQWRRTLAVILIGSKSPAVNTENVILRSHAHIGDTSAILASLRRMQVKGTPVMATTISKILSRVLRVRNRHKRPTTPLKRGQPDDLKLAIHMLRDIMEAGSFVPATYWRDIIKRLGMLGRFNELSQLCVFIASWYGPANQSAMLDPATKQKLRRYQVPKGVPNNHALHPLRILFPPALQSAIVEWGFIKAMKTPSRFNTDLVRSRFPLRPRVVDGIKLLEQLHHYGVSISKQAVRKAVVNRFIVYYGPGRSNRLYNRIDKRINKLSFHQMERQVNQALGLPSPPNSDFEAMIKVRANRRLQLRERKQKRRNTTVDPQWGLLSSPKIVRYFPAQVE